MVSNYYPDLDEARAERFSIDRPTTRIIGGVEYDEADVPDLADLAEDDR